MAEYKRIDFLDIKWLAIAAAIYGLLFCLVWIWLGGWVNFDAGLQWNQVHTGQYNNWHPVVHTLIFMKLPSLLWDDYRVVILLQIAIFAVVCSYLARTLKMCGIGCIARAAIMLCILLHPLTIFFVLTMPKDATFAIFVLLAIAATLRIMHSDGLDFRRWPTVVALVGGISIACLVRHNGILFAIPLLLVLCCKYVRKVKLDLAWPVVGILVVMGIVKLVIPCVVDVKPASQYSRQYFFIESAGVPLTMMGAVYVNHRDKMPRDAAEVLESIRPQEVWFDRYKLGTFNEVKYAGVAKLTDERIAGIKFPGWPKFAKMFCETVAIDPKLALLALTKLTEQVWNPVAFRSEDMAFPLMKTGMWTCRDYIIPVLGALHIPIFGLIPIIVWALIGLSIYSAVKQRYDALILTVPILCYDLGTMLLLSGFNMQRLFLCNILAGVPILWSIIQYERKD